MKRHETAIVVIYYKPKREQIEVFRRLSGHYEVVIVDNSNDALAADDVWNCVYIPLYGNKGIAAAQNVGIEKCEEIGVETVVFFDQDSDVSPQLIDNLISEFERKRKTEETLAAIGPTLVDKRSNSLYKSGGGKDSDGFVPTSALISSGTTTSIEVLKKVGGMDEKLFIDYVDFEWCWRAISQGYRLYRTERVVLPHTVGSKNTKCLGFPVIVSAPIRYYYKYRNTLILLRRKHVPLSWKFKTLIRQAFTLLHIMVNGNYKGRRKECLGNAIKGIREGLNILVKG